jgi:ubiquinone biosynthesis protein
MKLHKISTAQRTYRNLDRYRQILGILFKYGFDSVLDRINLGSYLGTGLQMIPRNRHEKVEGFTDYERIRMALEELGPTFIKMGQILSTRPDLIPLDLMQELTRLQDNVPPFPIAQVKEILQQELRSPMDAFFSRFDETPLAAASIGQVHRAQLITGEEVIVKVQRPGIKKVIEVDLDILCHIAMLMERHVEEARIYQPSKIVDEFALSIAKEINYEIEAQHAERFARQFANKKWIYIPKIFKKTTTERVLTMEYVEGIKVSDVDLLKHSGLNCKVIASRGADLTFEQLFKYGFFHADPHPGNICILPGNVICYFDFGMMDYVDKRSMDIFADMITGYVNRDKTVITDAAMRIAEWDEKPDRRALEGDIKGFVDRNLYNPLQDMHLGDLLRESLQILARHRLKLPPDLFFMIKAVAEVEGIGLMLDPDFNLVNKVTPFIKDIQKERIRPGRFIDDIIAMSSQLRQLPLDIKDLFRQLKLGKGKVHVEHKGLEPLISGISRSSNRIAFSLIIASLIIGSSVITAMQAGPSMERIPLLGILGYSLAAVMGLWMLISIWRSGRL